MSRSHLKVWILASGVVSALLCAQPIAAQVVPDNTLPAGERSQATGNPTVKIDGGARRGGNLFHSFSQFSVPTGGSAYFNNAADIRNIFSRVTGGSVSNIDGLIRANGTANLFLLNPNGILFGPNASLNIGGSFMGTTANAIGFPNGEVFSSDATQPLPSQLFSVNPNALFFNQLTPKPIINQSTANGTGLQVSPRQNLMLVGGPVQLENGRLTSPGSYVELGGVGGVGGVGTVSLSTAGEDWQIAIPDGVPRADVFLRNGGHIIPGIPPLSGDINGIIVIGNSGSIRVLGHNIDLLGSSLWVEIPSNSRLPDTRTGGIELNATGSIAISDSVVANRLFGQGTSGSITLSAGDGISFANSSRLYNTIDSGGVGNAGGLNITTGTLSLIEGTQLISGTRGLGSTGNVNINARDTVSLGPGRSGIFNIVDVSGIGNSGGINIMTGSLSFTNGAQLSSYTNGRGNAGSVTIHAHDAISLDGVDSNGYASGVFTSVAETGIGKAGDITIITGSLALTRGAGLSSSTFGQGDAGSVTDLTINARDYVLLDGESSNGTTASTIFTQVNPGAFGQGGNVAIATGTLFLTNGGAINTANTGGTGDAGRVTIQARDSVQIRGTAPSSTYLRSGVFTSATPGSMGNGGDVNITTGSLSVSDQGRIITNAEGQGNAGSIQIQASDTVLFDSADAISTLNPGGVGRGGDIEITARSLSVLNRAQLSASTAGEGNAGNITVSAKTFNIQNQAEVTVSSAGTGSAGSLFVDADRIFLNNQGSIRADTTGGGGNINLRSPSLFLRNGSNITTNATGTNIPGGNIAIDTQFLIAVPNEDSNISANSENFRGGNVRINAFSIFGIQPRPDATPLSNITATGETSALSGTIDVITAGIDPTSGLVALPTDLADSSGLIAQGCPANQGNSFVITGRGGLPPTPEQQLDDDAEWGDRRRLVVGQQVDGRRGDTGTQGHRDAQNSELKIQSSQLHPTSIIEATGWQVTSTGDISLVATTPNPTVQNRLNQAVACQRR